MRRTYIYKNGIVTIDAPMSQQTENIRRSTESFLDKVVKEEQKRGNSNQSRGIRKKQTLD